jgi:L-histidine Nalpha-methyltransferase
LDLVKDRSIIEPAYNDAAGVTAAFNKNVLTRLNRELGASFDPDCFDHAAPYIEAEHRIEMRLVSRRSQVVPIEALRKSYSFKAGEYIHTENSHKYTLDSFERLANDAGLATDSYWLDSKKWFAELLLHPIT